MPTVYKICPVALWRETERIGAIRGSQVDLRDGFIHFSTAEQVAEAAAKHFAGQRDHVLLCVDAATLGDKLKWERARRRAIPSPLRQARSRRGHAGRSPAARR